MKTLMLIFRNTLLLISLFFVTSCSATNTEQEIILVGSTPGDESIKSMLSISADTKVDFITWNLKLNSKSTFVLDIAYGESQPNTLGFKSNSQKRSIKGTFLIAKDNNPSRFKEVYHLKSNDLPKNISLAKISENVFHILTLQNQLMNGNGGYSYSLNRKIPADSDKILISSPAPDTKSLQLIFDGRTPCQEIASEHPEMNAGQSCFKLKWRLILSRDSITHLPTACTIRNIVNNQPRNISGKWEIINGTKANPDVIIYKIQADNLAEPILLLLADENVLYFIDNNNKPFIGNEDFSFAMNKKVQ